MQAGFLCGPAGTLLSKGFLVVANKVEGIVKVFDVISSILETNEFRLDKF